MIKTLLLATQFVIGSGAGALQNASAFNHEHYAITGSNSTTNVNISIDPLTFEKSNFSSNPYYYQTGRATEQNSYQSFVDVEYTIVQRNPYWPTPYQTPSEDPNITFEDATYETYYFIKLTPYYNYTNMQMTTSAVCNVDAAVGTDMSTGIHMQNYMTNRQEDQYKCTQIFNQYNYGNQNYDPLAVFTRQELDNMLQNNAYIVTIWGESDAIEYENNNQSAGTNIYYEQYNDLQGTWQKYRGDWQKNFVINNSRRSIYILQHFTLDIDASPDSKWPQNYYGNNNFSTNLTLTLETAINPTEPTDYEVVPIAGLMFDILTMPFAFISQAFNLTLFPNTAYSINISRLFLAIFAALVFIWMIKKFVKK